MTKGLIKIKKCRICGSSDLLDVIDLGKQPIPNGFLKKKEVRKKEPKYPLSVCFCNNCSLMQLKYLVNPKIMFKNYLLYNIFLIYRLHLDFDGQANKIHINLLNQSF